MRGLFPSRWQSAALVLAVVLVPPVNPARQLCAAETAPAETAPDSGKPRPHPSSADVKNELTTTIDAQLAAFRANDFAKAYTFAAGPIKDLFNAEQFEAMVRKGYPVIVRSTDVDYGMAFDNGEDAVIYVRVQNKETKGDAQYQYLLRKENGAWKIRGGAEVRSEGASI